MQGKATVEETSAYLKKHSLNPSAIRSLGRTGLQTSAIGFGCYRISNQRSDHREALEHSLKIGCNLIDTSTNYGDGESEACVGEALAAGMESGNWKREQIIVVSKVGYLQGENLTRAKNRAASKKGYADIVQYSADCWHCVHPDFLSDQLSESLGRLGLEKLDILLLHNPEYFFSDLKKRGQDPKDAHFQAEFYDRIRRAFDRLETEVEAGRIGAYGISSNTFVETTDHPEYTSLSHAWEIACRVAKDRGRKPTEHHFSVIQFPGNLFESGLVLNKNNGDPASETVLGFAKRKDLGVLINRPLNAFYGGELVRLADFPSEESSSTLGANLEALAKLENTSVGDGDFIPQKKLPLRWSMELSASELTELTQPQWENLEWQVIRPHLRFYFSENEKQMSADKLTAWHEWKKSYTQAMEKVLFDLSTFALAKSHAVSDEISHLLNPWLKGGQTELTLSQKSIGILAHLEGVSSVLVGMRSVPYVDDAKKILHEDKIIVDPKLFKTFREEN